MDYLIKSSREFSGQNIGYKLVNHTESNIIAYTDSYNSKDIFAKIGKNNMTASAVSFQYGSSSVTLETGKIARQASGSIMASMGDTVVLVTVVGNKSADPGRDFFPLTVDYQEKTYAAGKIPGGFFKREGRPTEKETLTCRLIDRPIRPLFPKGFKNEVQIICQVISLDPEVDPDIPALLGASAALSISGMPFAGPIGAAKVGYKDGEYVLNPGRAAVSQGDLELVVAGTKDAVLMVESEASGLSEEVMLGAVIFGHEQMQIAIDTITELAADIGKPAWNWVGPEADEDLVAAVVNSVALMISSIASATLFAIVLSSSFIM